MPNYTLTASTALYALSGNAALLARSRIMHTTTAAYQLTGRGANLRPGLPTTLLASRAAVSNPTPNAGGLASLVRGIQLPLWPDTMRSIDPAMQKWMRDVYEYLRRLAQQLTAGNIIQEIINNIGAGVVDVQYNLVTHTFQKKVYLTDGTISGWEDWSGGQPVKISNIVEDLSVDGSGNLQDLQRHDVYVLEMGAEDAGTIGCVCGGAPFANACWYKFTSALVGGVYQTPVLVLTYCGTPPASVPVGTWFDDGGTQTLWLEGSSCSGTCAVPTTPPPPPNPGCAGVVIGVSPNSLTFTIVIDEGTVNENTASGTVYAVGGYGFADSGVLWTIHCVGDGWAFSWQQSGVGPIVTDFPLTGAASPTDPTGANASGPTDAGGGAAGHTFRVSYG